MNVLAFFVNSCLSYGHLARFPRELLRISALSGGGSERFSSRKCSCKAGFLSCAKKRSGDLTRSFSVFCHCRLGPYSLCAFCATSFHARNAGLRSFIAVLPLIGRTLTRPAHAAYTANLMPAKVINTEERNSNAEQDSQIRHIDFSH